MKMFQHRCFLPVCLAACVLSPLRAEIQVRSSAVDHSARLGDTITYTISGGTNDPSTLSAVLVENTARVQTLSFILPEGAPREVVYRAKAAAPGVLLFAVDKGGSKGFGKHYADSAVEAAVISPEALKPSGEPSPDLLAYWEAFKRETEKIPCTPTLRLVSQKDGVELYDFEIDAGGGDIGTAAGVKAYGYMAKPTGQGPFPAAIFVYGAGAYEANPVESAALAKKGVMVWSVNPHPLPNDWSKQQREDAKNGVLAGYNILGKDIARENVYFNGMFRRDYQVARAVMQSPFWDKRHLVVRGGSQGGAQALALVFLCPQVNAAVVGVPAMCDMAAVFEGRAPGWPFWMRTAQKGKAYENAGTFDIVHLAPYMRADLLLSSGLLDTTCPTGGQIALYNAYAGPKEIIYMPYTGHAGDKRWIARSERFLTDRLGLK